MTLENNDIYEIADCLSQMRRDLVAYEYDGLYLTGEQVRLLRETYLKLARMSRVQGHEISRLRWNDQARHDTHRDTSQIADLVAQNQNIVAFPTGAPTGAPDGGSAA